METYWHHVWSFCHLFRKESKKENISDNLFKELKELNEIVDLLDEKTNQDILQAMFEVTGHLGLHGAQIKVFYRFKTLFSFQKIIIKSA